MTNVICCTFFSCKILCEIVSKRNLDLPREYDIVDWIAVAGLDPVIFFKITVTEQIHLRVFRPYEELQNNNITFIQC